MTTVFNAEVSHGHSAGARGISCSTRRARPVVRGHAGFRLRLAARGLRARAEEVLLAGLDRQPRLQPRLHRGLGQQGEQEGVHGGSARRVAARPVYVLLNSLDLFSFRLVGLFAAGFGVASRRTTAAAAGGVLALWAVYVLIKVGWTAVFSG